MIADTIHPLDKVIHSILHHPEPKDATRTTLNVLTQCAEKFELHLAPIIKMRRASVDRLVMSGTGEVLVETR